MRQTPNQRLADLILTEPLEQFVRTRRSDGKSWRLIERDLLAATEGQVDVSFETLRSWYPDAPTEVAS